MSAGSDAEAACAYVAERVRRAAGVRWQQGAHVPPPVARRGGDAVKLVASRRLWRVPRDVAAGLVAWANGERDVVLLGSVPAPRDVLALQAEGRRCVSLLPDASPENGLDFALHDLCHLEKFVDPRHHEEQVGFFASLDAATRTDAWRAIDLRYDEAWRKDSEHVAADMNGSAIFLFAALKMKLKMAARRDVARRAGRPAPTGGPLAPDEARAFELALEELLALLDLPVAARAAARAVSTKRDDPDAAHLLARHFARVAVVTRAARASAAGRRASADGPAPSSP